MKKIALFAGLVGLCASVLVSCNKEENNNGGNLDDVIEDGFYVTGAATGSDAVAAKYMMSAGMNEADGNAKRDGMYEKYVWLEAQKDFSLLLYTAGNEVRYSAVLEDYNTNGENDQVNVIVKRGKLVTGDDAPAMKVAETGFYHIVLDLNKAGDLALGAQIVLAPVKWGVSGSMNSWGNTFFPDPKKEGDKLTWILTEQIMPADYEFKFKYGNGWKIQLDDAGKVKANTNLGEGMIQGAPNIKGHDVKGYYTITLVYNLSSGDFSKCYSFTCEMVQDLSYVPDELFFKGDQFAEAQKTILTNKVGEYWAIRQIEAGKAVKFFSDEACTKSAAEVVATVDGATKVDGGFTVPETAMYIIYTNLIDKKITVEKATVYGIGDAFGNWTEGEHPFTVENGKASIKAAAAGNLRMYAGYSKADGGTWWTREFNIYDGKIKYRANGGELDAVAVSAGQTVTLDFNAGTGSIE